ncbi:MAG: FKBP-type peptidyl-prolyl cis-trans isomerase [Terrimonas sp.]|nr:FKBP-type peptidyl-prolyl cis-trans isomerase [Terrimonas sp.]
MSIQDKLKQFMANKTDAEKETGRKFLEENRKRATVTELEGGLQYEIITTGTGRQPRISDKVKAHYKGALLNGKEFDNSFKRGQPFTAPLTALIKGWQIAIPLMQEGSKWRLWIPSELAYGDRGAGADIPGGATLMFEVELLEIL